MKKILGILGGMGPQATIDLQQKILNLTSAQKDQDHIRIFTDSHPQIPDRMTAIISSGVSPASAMQKSLNKLISCGAQRIVMPCVTAHYYYKDMIVPPTIKFLNLLEITALACKSKFAGKKAGILCTHGTAKTGIVAAELEKQNIPYIQPTDDNMNLLSKLILQVKAKGDMDETARNLGGIASEMSGRGAEYFVLACTEIPLIVQHGDFKYPYVDCTEELAKAAIKACGYVVVFKDLGKDLGALPQTPPL